MDDGPRYSDEIATGWVKRLEIGGRIRAGSEASFVVLEEPGEPVLMHWSGHLVPHYRRHCPNCGGKAEAPKPYWYVGACRTDHDKTRLILELTEKCYESAAAVARRLTASNNLDLFGQPCTPKWLGILVVISRAGFDRSPRVLRCNQRVPVKISDPWPYRTREELARIWGIPIKPRLYRAEGGG